MNTWYLWAVNDDPPTNEYLAKIIGEGNEECASANKLCADGQRRNLFKCPKGYANVRSAIAAIPAFDLKVEVFKEEVEDVIAFYNLWKIGVKKAAKAKRYQIAFSKRPRARVRRS
jgi:hypothetical protein